MRLYLFLVLCLTPLLVTHAQFSTCDIRGTTPTLPCNYCTLSPTITIGANSTLPPTPQTTSVGLYSTSLALGTYSPSTTVATGPTAGPITIGVNTAVANTQSANYAQCSRYVQVAQGRPTCNAEFADFGQQVPTPFPTPTTFQQQCRVCSNSYYANFGTNSNQIEIAIGPTAGPITMGKTSTPSTQSVTINGASISVGSGPTAGPVAIGTTGTPSTQSVTVNGASIFLGSSASTTVQVAQGNCPTAYYGRFTSASPSQTLFIGENNPSPTPSPGQQCRICELSGVGTTLGSGPTAGPVAISTTSNTASITIGMNVPTGSPSPSQLQEAYLFEYSRNVRIAQKIPGQLQLGTDANSGVLIADGPTAGPITLGRTTPAGAPDETTSNAVNLNGIYHRYYSAGCISGTPSPTPTSSPLKCTYQIQSNYPTPSPSPTTGYQAASGFYYPPQVGSYLVIATCKSISGSISVCDIWSDRTSPSGSVQHCRASAGSGVAGDITMSCSAIIKFNVIGSGNFIYVATSNIFLSSVEAVNTFSVTRVA